MSRRRTIDPPVTPRRQVRRRSEPSSGGAEPKKSTSKSVASNTPSYPEVGSKWWSRQPHWLIPILIEALIIGGIFWGLGEWREEHRADDADKRALQQMLYTSDLKGIVLRGEDLSGMNLSGRQMQESDLTLANLQGSLLWGTDLSLASLLHADLRGAKMPDVTLTGTALTWARMDKTTYLDGAKWDPKLPPQWPDGFDAPDNAWEPNRDG